MLSLAALGERERETRMGREKRKVEREENVYTLTQLVQQQSNGSTKPPYFYHLVAR